MSDAVPSLWGGGHASISSSGGAGAEAPVSISALASAPPFSTKRIPPKAYHEVSQPLELVDRGEPSTSRQILGEPPRAVISGICAPRDATRTSAAVILSRSPK